MKTLACHVYCIFRINLHQDSWVAHQIWLRWPFTGSVPILHLTFQPDHGREEQADTSSHQSHGGKWRNEEMQIGLSSLVNAKTKRIDFRAFAFAKKLDWNDCGEMFLNLSRSKKWNLSLEHTPFRCSQSDRYFRASQSRIQAFSAHVSWMISFTFLCCSKLLPFLPRKHIPSVSLLQLSSVISYDDHPVTGGHPFSGWLCQRELA